jgi:hypothetical protein
LPVWQKFLGRENYPLGRNFHSQSGYKMGLSKTPADRPEKHSARVKRAQDKKLARCSRQFAQVMGKAA